MGQIVGEWVIAPLLTLSQVALRTTDAVADQYGEGI